MPTLHTLCSEKKLVPVMRKMFLGPDAQFLCAKMRKNNLGREVGVSCAKMRKKIFFFLHFFKNFGHLAHQFMIFFGHLAHQLMRTGPQRFCNKIYFFF